ncbi:MAG TPA: crosslink repair DNA glycosylase YcaQ family protein, partial [Solirubrobacteraceae bacterium]|nr:crosslink repair DNA glycosylase YcaQ family protein [Solirubrobacteraceae bacterium]
FAPSDDRTVRFRRAPDTSAARPPVDEAVNELTRRYLAMYGPARRDDLSRWWGGGSALSAAKAQGRFEALGDEAVAVDVEGERCWMLAADLAAALGPAGDPPGAARLLPLFDVWTVSLNRNVDAILARDHRPLVYRQAGWISPVVLVDGAVAGTWKHETTKGSTVVTIEPFGKLPRWAADQLDAEAERLRGFLGSPTSRGTS